MVNVIIEQMKTKCNSCKKELVVKRAFKICKNLACVDYNKKLRR
jgi:hypothetical protein|tara:strand:- start:1406 stop:1537 length:132 start_codon:yes stop_codon:yes gene_type:complete